MKINMAALCWTFIGSAILCYAYTAYVILCAIALSYSTKKQNRVIRFKATPI